MPLSLEEKIKLRKRLSPAEVKKVEKKAIVLKGEKGDKGLDGKDGKNGNDGTAGKDGRSIKGDKGDTGEKGNRGLTGEDGNDGKDGLKGETGDKGKTGENGRRGPRAPGGGYPRTPRVECLKSTNDVVQMCFEGEGDDRGVHLTGGQFSNGTPEEGQEAIFGEGDSYPVPFAFHCQISNTTGLTITDAVDVSEIMQSDDLSTIGLFGGIAEGDYILVGSNRGTFGGAKAKIDTLGTVEPEYLVAEYLQDDSPTWVQSSFMSTSANPPLVSYANCISCVDNEQWRFGANPFAIYALPWDQVTMNINGVDYEDMYWGRFRIITGITSDPIMQQLKLHTNRFEINADGTTEYFGRSRYERTLSVGLDKVIGNAIYTPLGNNVQYGPNLTVAYKLNRFANNAIDGFALIQNIVEGLDTSIPLVLAISYYPVGAVTGDVEFNLEVFQVEDGFVYDGNSTPDTYAVIDSITAAAALTRRTAFVLINVDHLTPERDALVLSLYRDARVANIEDTLASNVVITNIKLTGFFWKP